MIKGFRLIIFLLIVVLAFQAKAENIDPTTFNYSKVDSVALAMGKYQFNSIESLSSYINKKFTTDHERLRAIFIWITNNIDYSYSHLHADEESVFRTKKAVCNGYSILLKKLCDNSQINCRVVVGWTKGYTGLLDTTNHDFRHAWNLVTLYDQNYLIDATWAAGAYEMQKKKWIKEFKNEYYLGKPQFFISRHFPDDLQDQLLPKPISFSEFINSPIIKIGSVNNNLTNIIPDKSIIKTRYRFGNEFSFTSDQEIHTIQIQINYPNSSLIHLYDIEFEKDNNHYAFMWPFEYYGNFFATILLNNKESIAYNVIIE